MEIISRLKIKYLLTLSLLMIATILFSTVAVLAAQNVNVNSNVSIIYNAPCVMTSGSNVNNVLKNYNCTSVIFGKTSDYSSTISGITPVDLSANRGTGLVNGYYDESNTTFYILANRTIIFYWK